MENDMSVIVARLVLLGLFLLFLLKIRKNNLAFRKKDEQLETNYNYLIDRIIDVLSNDSELKFERKVSEKVRFCGYIVLIISILIIIFGARIHQLFVYFGILLITLALNIFNYKNEKYRELFKKNVIERTIKEYDSNAHYDKNGCFPIDIYTEATVGYFDQYNSEDLLIGTLDNCQYLIAEVHTKDKRTDEDGKTYYVTSFKGQVAALKLPMSYNFDLIISDNTLKIYDSERYIELDNPEFEQYFDVSTTDRLIAMKVLTPAVTYKLIDLKNRFGFAFEMRLINNILVFRFFANDLFEPNPLNIRREAIEIARYFEILNGIKEIMHEVLEALKKV